MNRVASLTFPAHRSDCDGVAYAAAMESPDQLRVFVTRDGDVFHAHPDKFGVTADGSDLVGPLVNFESALRPRFPGGVVPPFSRPARPPTKTIRNRTPCRYPDHERRSGGRRPLHPTRRIPREAR